MKTVILVNIAPVYISNDSCQPVNLLGDEKLYYSMFPHLLSFVEVYTPLVKFSGKTYKDLQRQIDEYTEHTSNYDFQSIIIKK